MASDHWSIGEVLSLLQDEFPEVTISKIRFLESQGLINPERTASGYRRFYPPDFDRLQWILGQQRDHYLPLKVIRDRLESPDFDLEAELASTHGTPTLAPSDASPQPEAGSTASVEPSAARVGAPPVTVPTTRASSDASAVKEPPVALSPRTAAKVAAIEESPQVVVTERRGTGGGSQADTDLNLALTVEELAEASGCDVPALLELERFDLIQGRKIGPTMLYDGEALLIARLASQFSEFGLEPRHLRTLRIGAEREVGLLGQVVEPILHRRDPQTRSEAIKTFESLVDLAANLRTILVRQMVREQLPSQRG